MPTIKTKKERVPKLISNNTDFLQKDREEKEETLDMIRVAKNEIFEKSKENLPTILKEKTDSIVNEVLNIAEEWKDSFVYTDSKYGEKLERIDYGLLEARITPLIASRSTNFYFNATYSADELFIIYQEFMRMISEINKKIKYLPTKKKFCLFAGMSSQTYNNYMQDFDNDKRNIMQMIDDYISDTNLTSAQNGDIREITTIFRSKAEHGMIEAQAPVVIEHKKEADLDEIKRKLSRFKEGTIIDAEFVEKE